MENSTIMSKIETLVKNVMDKDYSSANKVFNDVIGEKLSTSLEMAKMDVAKSIYTTESVEEESEGEAITEDQEEASED